MPEKLRGEKGSVPENLEDQKYRELQAAHGEENRIMAEMEKVLADTPDKARAEKVVLEQWAPLMDGARKKADEALKAWFDAMKKSQ